MRPGKLKSSANLEDYGQVLQPHEAFEPILERRTRAALLEWMEEIWAADLLKAAKLKPRVKAMLSGPPGCGKTTMAHHMAARLGLPLLVVQSERIVEAYIGSTGQNIGGLFDAAAQTDCVLFIDEFDTLGTARMKAKQGAEQERNSSVNVLLQRLEKHTGIVIAATNRPDDLDEAVWRRFQLQITIGMPGQDERERILALYLDPYVLTPRDLTALARETKGATPALLREFCEALKRNLVLGPQLDWDMALTAVIERVLAGCQPHPDLVRPALWSLQGGSPSLQDLNWPLAKKEA